MRHTSLLCQGLLQCRYTTPFSPPSSSLLPPREIHKGKPLRALTPSCHTAHKPLMKATPLQTACVVAAICLWRQQAIQQSKTAKYPFTSSSPHPQSWAQTRCYSLGPAITLTALHSSNSAHLALFFPPSHGPSFLLLSHCENAQITDTDE